MTSNQPPIDTSRRNAILSAYAGHVERFDEIARRYHPTPYLADPGLAVSAHVENLTRRQVEVLSLIADGLSNQEISVELELALETIKSHVLHILQRLDARTRAHAVSIGHQRGLLGCRVI